MIYHRTIVYSSKGTIANFGKNIQKITAANLDLPGGLKLYLNENLCSCYRVFWSKSKTLCSISKIKIYFPSNGTVEIRLQKLGSAILITHVNDFKKVFNGVDSSAPR